MNTLKHPRQRRTVAVASVLAASALLLTACSTPAASTDGADAASGTSIDAAQSRVTLTYDGGIYVLDGTSLELESDIPLEGFNRLNPSGDGRHALVTTAEGFQVLDAGTWTDDAGDHYTAEPALTDLVFEADTAGHVVRHGEKTVLFADGTGDISIYNTGDLLTATDELPQMELVKSEEAHHGVAIELEDGTLLSTLGTPDARTGIRVLDADRAEIARSEECPSVHGEGAAANEVAVFGCSDGVLVYDAGTITKIEAEDEYGRTGNVYVSETSTIAVGDYNSDPDAEGYDLTELLLIDTVAKTSTVLDLPEGVGYTWRDVARGPNDEAVLLGNDGQLHLIDVTTGDITATYPVIEAWEPPIEWQDAHPALTVLGDTAYVTDTATSSVHAVDLATGEITATAELDAAPIEIAVVTGD